MAVTNGWGKGTQNNSNGWGKFQNTIGAASIYEDSYSGETVLIGTSAAFSYSKSSFHQGEADPTPTITGTTGGTFNADAGLVFVDTGTHNSSTGQIDLSASTIDSHIITYTVGGVQSGQTIAVTASPFVDNNFSMEFDGVNDKITATGVTMLNGLNTVSFSLWVKAANGAQADSFACILGIEDSTTSLAQIVLSQANTANNFNFFVRTASGYGTPATTGVGFLNGDWRHIAGTYDGTNLKLYVDGSEVSSVSRTGNLISATGELALGAFFTSNYFDGKIDEVAIWNTALSSDAVTEIYNATANNTGKVLDLNTNSGNYTSSANLQYWNRLGD